MVNAIGDGNSHPISSVFDTLAHAQATFTAAATATGRTVALTDELDWWVIQTFLVDGGNVYMPAGIYVLHGGLILPNGLAKGLSVHGDGKGVAVLTLRNGSSTGGSAALTDCCVIIDEAHNVAATGTGYNFNNAINANPSVGLSLTAFTVDGNSANVGKSPSQASWTLGYNMGVAIAAHGDINVDLEVRNCAGHGYREEGTSLTYVQRGRYWIDAHDNGYWGVYIGYRNRQKQLDGIAARNGLAGNAGSVKGSIQNTTGGGFFLDCSEMQTGDLQAHGNNGDGIFIRNVFACQYGNFRATYNGGAGIHVLGLVNSMGVGWLAQNNGTNPGYGQTNLSTPAPDTNGVASGGGGTYTGAPDIWFEDTSTMNYGITNQSIVSVIECGQNATVTNTWGESPAEAYGLWLDDGIGATGLTVRGLHNTSSYRKPTSITSTSLLIGDTFASLTDVVSTSPSGGQVWGYTSGTGWGPINAGSGGGASVTYGTFASRPIAASAGADALYCATDVGNIYQSTGTAWTLAATGLIEGTSLPSSPADVMFFLNTNTDVLSFYDGSGWITLGSASAYSPSYTLITSSETWTVPATGTYRIRATGGGGGGGGGGGASSTQAGGGGGAAGSPADVTVTLTSGANYTVTIGGGGTGGGGVSSGQGTTGNTGSNTAITGTGLSLAASGGGGGAGSVAGTTPGAGGIPGITATGTQRFPGFGGCANGSSGCSLPSGTVGGGQGAAASGSLGGAGGSAGVLGTATTAAGSGTNSTSSGSNGTSAATNSGGGGGGGGGANTGGTGGTGGNGGSGFIEIWRVA